MVVFAILARPTLYGQCSSPPPCIYNPGMNGNPSLPAWGQPVNSTLPDWYVLSGSPLYAEGTIASHGVRLDNSEGIYACFNFVSGRKYKVCFLGYNPNTTSSGNIILEAHNGSSGQQIASINFYNYSTSSPKNMSLQTAIFTANSNFTQLRVYVPNLGNSYAVVVDDVGVIEVPILTATPSTINGCGTSTLNASSNNQLNISWSPNYKLNSTTGSTVYASPCETTTYTATYSLVNCWPYTCTSGTEQVTVTVDPGVNVTASPQSISGCGSSTLTATSANPMNVTWSPTTNMTGSGNTVTVRPCQTTTYTATFTCSNGCVYTRNITVFVTPGTNATATPPVINVCGNSVLTATSTNPMSVTWSPTNGLTPSNGVGNTVTASPCDTTVYTATFFCAQNQCSYTRPVTVYVQPGGSINNTTGKPCGSTIDLEFIHATPCPGSSYRWYSQKNPGTLLSSSSKYIKISSTSADQGLYYVIVTTPQGCVDTFYTSVVMDCCKLFVDFKPIGCNPIRFENLTLDSIGGNPVILGEWHWDFGDGNSSSIRNPSHIYRQFWGPTTVCLTAVVEQDGSTCCARVCKEVDVCDFGCDPKAAFDYALVTPGTTLVQFTDKSVGGNSPCPTGAYEWKVNGVVITSANGIPNPLINLGPPLPGPGNRYHVCLKVRYCIPNTSTPCEEEWCEIIEIP